MAKFIDKDGQFQAEVNIGGLDIYKEAVKKGISARQLINKKFPTQAGQPEPFKQMCANAGIRFQADPLTGQPASTMDEIINPEIQAGSFVSQPGVPESRLLYPAAQLALMEDKLNSNEDQVTSVLDSIVGFKQTISTRKFEQPVLNYQGGKGPEDSQYQHISQNTRPALMLSLTASDVSRVVPTTSIGMEISQEALQSTPMDFVGMTFARFDKVASYNSWVSNLTYLLSGDPDSQVTSFSAGTSALSTFTAQSLDAAVTTAGTISHKAYRAYLLKQPLTMFPDTVICDTTAAMAVEDRAGRPTNVMNNSTDRIDAPMKMIWPPVPDSINFIGLPIGTFPANTLMGIDSSQAIGKVTSLFSEYRAIEDVVMKRSQEMRFDKGSLYYRIFDDAFSVMTLTVA